MDVVMERGWELVTPASDQHWLPHNGDDDDDDDDGDDVVMLKLASQQTDQWQQLC